MAIFGIFVTKWFIENLGSVLFALKPVQDIKQKKRRLVVRHPSLVFLAVVISRQQSSYIEHGV